MLPGTETYLITLKIDARFHFSITYVFPENDYRSRSKPQINAICWLTDGHTNERIVGYHQSTPVKTWERAGGGVELGWAFKTYETGPENLD